MEISEEMYKAAFTYGKQVYKGEISKNAARAKLSEEFGMNTNSAADYLSNFSHMMKGEKFTRTMKGEATEYFIVKIREDFGNNYFLNALHSVEQHVDYYEKLGRGNLPNIREICKKLRSTSQREYSNVFPDELEKTHNLTEGAKRQITVNSYERNPRARAACINHHKPICSVCDFDFSIEFGEIGEGFIHVHHTKRISKIGEKYEVDPINDLIPVCPNCHAMLHRRDPPYKIKELKSIKNI
jgi:5-methylcytosine-specific restriction enzyme A